MAITFEAKVDASGFYRSYRKMNSALRNLRRSLPRKYRRTAGGRARRRRGEAREQRYVTSLPRPSRSGPRRRR